MGNIIMQNLGPRAVLWLLSLPTRLVNKINQKIILKGFRRIGKNFAFDGAGSIFSQGTISIGNNVFIGKNAYIAGDISIGNNVMFGANPTVLAGDHIFAVRGKSPRFIKPLPGQNSNPIVIEDEVWAGANVTILGGVTVGIGAVIGAGSVVVKDVCPFTISVGNPCRPVRRIFEDEQLELHLREIGYPQAFAQEVVKRRATHLNGLVLPVVDNTDRYSSVIYEPL